MELESLNLQANINLTKQDVEGNYAKISSRKNSDVDEYKIKLNIMDGISDKESVSLWQDVFVTQTKLFMRNELKWLTDNEFNKGKGVIEIGSALGYHGSMLAYNLPNLRIFGLEAIPAFVNHADSFPENYSVDECVLGVDRIPEKLKGNYSNIFMRYVLQHLSDPSSILKEIYAMLPNEGKLFIIEDEYQFAKSLPVHKPFETIISFLKEMYSITGSNFSMGSQLPKILQENGFKILDYQINTETNIQQGDLFLDYIISVFKLVYLSKNILSDLDYDLIIKEIQSLKTNNHKSLLTFAQVYVVAVKA